MIGLGEDARSLAVYNLRGSIFNEHVTADVLRLQLSGL
jgi:hypothetical protein